MLLSGNLSIQEQTDLGEACVGSSVVRHGYIQNIANVDTTNMLAGHMFQGWSGFSCQIRTCLL